MNKTSAVIATVAALAFGAHAFAAEAETTTKTSIEADSKGNVDKKSKTVSTDSAGTKTVSEKKVEVDVKSDGAVEKTAKTETSTDPKGMMNKSKTVTKDSEKTAADGSVETSHKKTVDGKTVEATTEKK